MRRRIVGAIIPAAALVSMLAARGVRGSELCAPDRNACEGQLPGGASFVSVIDAIQGDGFNPLWQEVQISFNAGVTPQQFTSDNDILAAATAQQITLTPTTEVYRCAVIGKP